MDFILQNASQVAPQLEATGVLNLRDWTMPTSTAQILHRDTVTLPSGQKVLVSQFPNMPSEEVVALSDDDLIFVANQGMFPEVWCQLFFRGITEEVRAIAPMLSMGPFYEAHKQEITARLEANLSSDESSEWVEYYATCLSEFPIFKIATFGIEEKYRELIGTEYLNQFNDIKYLSADQISKLTTEQKYKILYTTLKDNQNDPGKRDIALKLFTADDVLSTQEAATLLGLTTSSVVCGSLMSCPAFYTEHDNAYNTVATWIHHCVNEKIGTNQSVWYKFAQDIEVQHGFSLSGGYIKNVQGQAIGGISSVGGFGADMQLVKQNQQPYNGPKFL